MTPSTQIASADIDPDLRWDHTDSGHVDSITSWHFVDVKITIAKVKQKGLFSISDSNIYFFFEKKNEWLIFLADLLFLFLVTYDIIYVYRIFVQMGLIYYVLH